MYVNDPGGGKPEDRQTMGDALRLGLTIGGIAGGVAGVGLILAQMVTMARKGYPLPIAFLVVAAVLLPAAFLSLRRGG